MANDSEKFDILKNSFKLRETILGLINENSIDIDKLANKCGITTKYLKGWLTGVQSTSRSLHQADIHSVCAELGLMIKITIVKIKDYSIDKDITNE